MEPLNTVGEKAMYPVKRATKYCLLLLLVLVMGLVVPARADTITVNLLITWVNTGVQPNAQTITNGSLVIDTTAQTLLSYSIPVPAPLGTVTQNNSFGNVYVAPGAPSCGQNLPCFEVQITQFVQPNSQNVVVLTFGGALHNFLGGTLLNVNGAFSKAQCDDPCQFYAYGGTNSPPVPEPASLLLFGGGLIALVGIAGRKLRR